MHGKARREKNEKPSERCCGQEERARHGSIKTRREIVAVCMVNFEMTRLLFYIFLLGQETC